MQDRTRRALAALAEIDACQLYLCPTCEGLLLTTAAGLPLPMILDEDSEPIDGKAHLEAMLDRIFTDSLRG